MLWRFRLRRQVAVGLWPYRICFIKYVKIYVPGNSRNPSFGAVLPANSHRGPKGFYKNSLVIGRIGGQPVIIGKAFCIKNMGIPVKIAVDSKKITSGKNNPAECLYNFCNGRGAKSPLAGPFQIIKYRKVKSAVVQCPEYSFRFFIGLCFI